MKTIEEKKRDLISSMGWNYENTEMSGRWVAEHAVKTMFNESEVLDMLDRFWDTLDLWYNNQKDEAPNIKHWLRYYKKEYFNKEYQQQINDVIDVLNRQGEISDGAEPYIIEN